MQQVCDIRVREGKSARSPSAFRQIHRQTAARHSQDSDGRGMPSNLLLFICRQKYNILYHIHATDTARTAIAMGASQHAVVHLHTDSSFDNHITIEAVH